MLELTPSIAQRTILRITNHPHSQSKLSIIETLYGVFYDHIRTEYGLEPEWNRFCSYTQLDAPDNQAKLQTASVFMDETARYPYLWALRVKARDKLMKRRNWITHIGIRLDNENEATVFFAKLYYDHIAGSFSVIKQPISAVPAFIDNLLFSGRLLCMAGALPLPPQALPLDGGTVSDFTALLFDPQRFLPMVVITCPDLLNPYELSETTKGNLIVFWLDDPGTLELINHQLPDELRIEWDSVRVFLPLSDDARFHPSFSASDITRMGSRQLIGSFRQAYCVGLRADDRRAFVTVDTILSQRDIRSSAALQNRLASNAAELTRLREENGRLKADCEKWAEQIKASAKYDHQAEINEYEMMLSEFMKEADLLKRGVSALVERLYTDMGKSFQPDESEADARLCELQHAIFACLARSSHPK